MGNLIQISGSYKHNRISTSIIPKITKKQKKQQQQRMEEEKQNALKKQQVALEPTNTDIMPETKIEKHH